VLRPCSLRRPLLGAAALLCGAVFYGTCYADDASTAPPNPGVWQEHVYTFHFMGFTTTYSCDGLADKLKVLLLAAGARADAKSRPGVCSLSYGSPDKFAQANLTFYTLVPAGQNLNAAPHVGGVWLPVRFGVRSPRELALGDCELVEQFRALVLPMFATRSIDDQMTCVPHQDSGSVINLKFESFVALPAKPANARAVQPAASSAGA